MIQLVLSTCSPEAATTVAASIVEARLAACCNQLPGVKSTYWWDDQLTTDEEVLLVFKTTPELVEALMTKLRAVHPYEVPEIVSLQADRVSEAYAAWVLRETAGRPS